MFYTTFISKFRAKFCDIQQEWYSKDQYNFDMNMEAPHAQDDLVLHCLIMQVSSFPRVESYQQ